jgi:hypothetical protein
MEVVMNNSQGGRSAFRCAVTAVSLAALLAVAACAIKVSPSDFPALMLANQPEEKAYLK